MDPIPTVSNEALLARLSADYRDGMLSFEQRQSECPSTTGKEQCEQKQTNVTPTAGTAVRPQSHASFDKWNAGFNDEDFVAVRTDSRAGRSVSLRISPPHAYRSSQHSNQSPL